jgi:hypothetical protein
VFGFVVFLTPMCLAMLWYGIPFFLKGMYSGEMSSNAGGLIRWPVYLMMPLGFGLLLLQGWSELIKRLAFLQGPDRRPHRQEAPSQPRPDHVRGADLLPADGLSGRLQPGRLRPVLRLHRCRAGRAARAILLQALPLRIFGIMQNDTLLAIPFFTLMGLILERSAAWPRTCSTPSASCSARCAAAWRWR